LKKVTPTPNRFTTSTPSWWAKGFIVFGSLFLLGSCLDDAALIGSRKEARFDVKFKEFSIPVTTVQADSIGSENNGVPTQSTSVYDRMLCGSANDPKFGEIKPTFFAQYLPPPLKINQTGLTDFSLNKVTVKFAMDYYVYGDTLNGPSQFTLHEIDALPISNFTSDKDYFTNSDEVGYDPTPLATANYQFVKNHFDSALIFRARNADTDRTNDVFDTLTFNLPIGSDADLARRLYDTALAKGIYTKVKIANTNRDTLRFDVRKTDSVFLRMFRGFAVKSTSGARVLGFKSLFSSERGSSLITLYYGYKKDGVQKSGKLNYSFQGQLSYTKIEPTNRGGTTLGGLVTKYTDYNAPDNYGYLQGGTGVYAKLDFTEVNDFLGQIENLAVNSAELIIPVEAPTVRSHLSVPSGLFLRTVQNNNRFYNPPKIPIKGTDGKDLVDSQGNPILGPDPQYGFRYYSATNDTYLDALGDDAKILNLQYVKNRGNEYFYRGYLTQFIEYHNRLPESFSHIDYLGLVPSNFQYGKTLDGVSFKKDQVKLRVYYTEIQN
jgi:Domain of unknown function (DUF4270)